MKKLALKRTTIRVMTNLEHVVGGTFPTPPRPHSDDCGSIAAKTCGATEMGCQPSVRNSPEC